MLEDWSQFTAWRKASCG